MRSSAGGRTTASIIAIVSSTAPPSPRRRNAPPNNPHKATPNSLWGGSVFDANPGSGFRANQHQRFSIGLFAARRANAGAVRAALRRAQPPREARFRAFFSSLSRLFSVSAKGARHTRPSIGAGLRLLVCYGKRLHAGDPAPERGSADYVFTMGRTSQVMDVPGR
jgi:hypothetical protein